PWPMLNPKTRTAGVPSPIQSGTVALDREPRQIHEWALTQRRKGAKMRSQIERWSFFWPQMDTDSFATKEHKERKWGAPATRRSRRATRPMLRNLATLNCFETAKHTNLSATKEHKERKELNR